MYVIAGQSEHIDVTKQKNSTIAYRRPRHNHNVREPSPHSLCMVHRGDMVFRDRTSPLATPNVIKAAAATKATLMLLLTR